MAPHTIKKRKLTQPELKLSESSESVSSSGDSVREHSQDKGLKKVYQRSAWGRKTSLVNQPSVLHTNGSNNTNMFNIQLDELLTEVKPNYQKRMRKLKSALHKLKSVIENIPPRGPLPLLEAVRELRKTSDTVIPFPEPRPGNDVKYTFSYQRPVDISVVGSYALKTSIKTASPLLIDLAVTMPTTVFQDKDYLNYRYFYKRAYYLACIAAGIRETKDCNFMLSFIYHNDSPLQPTLVISPSSNCAIDDFSNSKCHLKIIMAAEQNLFPITKTLPDQNCVRFSRSSSTAYQSPNSPTPLYNAIVRSECCVASYLKLLNRVSLKAKGFKDACVLGSLWLRQRGLRTGISHGGFGHFELASMMAILIQKDGLQATAVLSTKYSSYQLFKAFLQFLVNRDLFREPFGLPRNVSSLPSSNTPIFFDRSRALNILFKMTASAYELLRHEASVSLRMLSSSTSEQFRRFLISNLDIPTQRFDVLFHISISQSWEPVTRGPDTKNWHLECYKRLYELLTVGLGDRVNVLYLRAAPPTTWPTTKIATTKEINKILVGILVQPENVGRTIDQGPAAEDRGAAAVFRKFWGEKAELRRFRDGSILESLIWAEEKGQDTSVMQQIVTFVIQRHVGVDAANSLKFLANDLDQKVAPKVSSPDSSLNAFHNLFAAYGAFEKNIREMEGLPLQIRQVSAADAHLRYASITPQILGPSHSACKPIDITVQFEGSTRWPENIRAIQRTKAALLLKSGELLKESFSGLTSRLGLENVRQEMHNSCFLDITYREGPAFRVRIHHDRELAVLNHQLNDKNLKTFGREEVAAAVSNYKKLFLYAPSHTQALCTLCTRLLFLSPTIRLMKTWCFSHLLTSQVSEELIELLTIHTFVDPYPWQVPGSVRTGFLRTLSFISQWDWRSEPLIVDMNGQMTTADINATKLRFEAWRKIDPAMDRVVIFAASNLDPDGITWTKQGPSKVVAARLTSLAKAACNVTKEQELTFKANSLFATSFADYDFVIYLRSEVILGRQDKVKPTFKNLEVPRTDPTFVGYDPLSGFLEELESIYGYNIVFFHNTEIIARPAIAGLWTPHTRPREWKVNTTYSTMPVRRSLSEMEGGPLIEINKASVLNEIARLGGDMILRIESRD